MFKEGDVICFGYGFAQITGRLIEWKPNGSCWDLLVEINKRKHRYSKVSDEGIEILERAK